MDHSLPSQIRERPLHELPLFQALEEGGSGHGLAAFGSHELFEGLVAPERGEVGIGHEVRKRSPSSIQFPPLSMGLAKGSRGLFHLSKVGKNGS